MLLPPAGLAGCEYGDDVDLEPSGVADQSTRTITVACVGASHAQLFLRQDEGDRRQLTFDCAATAQATVGLDAGPVTVSVMRYNGGGSGPGSGDVAGLRIVPASPRSWGAVQAIASDQGLWPFVRGGLKVKVCPLCR